MQRFVIPHNHEITKEDRQKLNGHGSVILWFTGLPSAGKSTLANEVEKRLITSGVRTFILDGDNVRMGLCKDLGFSEADRAENIRRIGEVSKLFINAGCIVLSAFVSPYRKDRDAVRALVDDGEFVEVYVQAPLEICEQRDVKGLYKKAREGVIKGFTGIDDPYEAPLEPEMIIETDKMTLGPCKGGVVRLVVTDNGPGVPTADREKLFMPYYSTKGRGSGLGLAIVRRIVAEHGGGIDVGDATPNGTVFTVELPAA